MCKYCTNDINERENYIIDFSDSIDYGDLNIGIESLYIEVGNAIGFQFIDLIRLDEKKNPLHWGAAANPHFSYCPFCGRKLEE